MIQMVIYISDWLNCFSQVAQSQGHKNNQDNLGKGNSTLRTVMSAKQKTPKLCMGRMVCHTEFPSSSLSQTRISVKAKMVSNISNTIHVASI